MSEIRVSAIVVTYNSRDDIGACLTALADQTGVTLEAIVVDNASSDGTVDLLREHPLRPRLVANGENVGFSRGNNQGLGLAKGDFVLLLNPDTLLQPGCLAALVTLLDARPSVALVGPLTRNPDGTPQVSFGPRLTLANEWHQRRLVDGVRQRRPAALAAAEALVTQEQHPDWVSASCALVRREALQAVGGFDERFFLYEEDVDLCVRLRAAGHEVLHTPAGQAVHLLGRSMSSAAGRARIEYQRSHIAYYRKHHGRLQLLGLRLLLAAGAWLGRLRARDKAQRALQRQLLRIALED